MAANDSAPAGGGVPRGRDEVVAALLDAAGRELAAKGVAGASVRAIATAAGVNHGLVHRHFGSKDAMVAAVLDDLARRITARAAADPAWPFGAAPAGESPAASLGGGRTGPTGRGAVTGTGAGGHARRAPGAGEAPGAGAGEVAGDDELLDRFWRVLARTILDGGDPDALRRHHPYVQGVVARLREGGLPDERARLAAAQAVALTLGWLLFEPFLEASTGLDPAARTGRRQALSSAASALVDRHRADPP